MSWATSTQASDRVTVYPLGRIDVEDEDVKTAHHLGRPTLQRVQNEQTHLSHPPISQRAQNDWTMSRPWSTSQVCIQATGRPTKT